MKMSELFKQWLKESMSPNVLNEVTDGDDVIGSWSIERAAAGKNTIEAEFGDGSKLLVILEGE